MDNFGFLKVAAAVPHVRVADCDYNTERIAAMAEEAARRGVEIVAFPELARHGLHLRRPPVAADAARRGRRGAGTPGARHAQTAPGTLIAGAPLRHGSTLYNCAVVFTQGKVLGVVPKTYIPDYAEFYENRWFASGAGISDEHIAVAGQQADFGADLTFEVNGAEFGIEICEDLWTAAPPSSQLALNGAKVIFNLSASPESVGKHAYLRQLVAQQSARTLAAYVYCSAGFGESSTDLVFAGNGSSPKTAGYSANRGASRSTSSSSWPTSTFSGWNSNAAATPRSARTKGRRRTPSSKWRSRGPRPRRSTAHRPDAVRTAGRRPQRTLRGDFPDTVARAGAPAGAHPLRKGRRRHFGRTGFDARTARDGPHVRPAGTRPRGNRRHHDARFRHDRPHLRQRPGR